MKEIICWLTGHEPELIQKKEERLIHWGETRPQYRTVNHIFCKRCGKWQHPYTGDYESA